MDWTLSVESVTHMLKTAGPNSELWAGDCKGECVLAGVLSEEQRVVLGVATTQRC